MLLKMLLFVRYFEEVGLEGHYNVEQEVAVEKQQELEVIVAFAEGQMRIILELNYLGYSCSAFQIAALPLTF